MNPHALTRLAWLLRIAVALTFIGHGAFAFQVKPQWIPYLVTVGFSVSQAQSLMPWIGILDFIVAFLILVRPFSAIILWTLCWTFATALIRPLSGESWWEFIERGANYGTPLALWYLQQKNKD